MEHLDEVSTDQTDQNVEAKITEFRTELSDTFRQSLRLLGPAEALEAALDAPLTRLQRELSDARRAAQAAQLHACKVEAALQRLREAHHKALRKFVLHSEGAEVALSTLESSEEGLRRRQGTLHRLLEVVNERQHELDESQELLRQAQEQGRIIEELGRKQDKLEGMVTKELRRAEAERLKAQRKVRLQDRELRRLQMRCRELGGDAENADNYGGVRQRTRYQTRQFTRPLQSKGESDEESQEGGHALVDVNTCTIGDLAQVAGVCRPLPRPSWPPERWVLLSATLGPQPFPLQGGFSCLEDLGGVPGVGPSLLETLQLCLTCSPKERTHDPLGHRWGSGSSGSSCGSREELAGEVASSVHRLLGSEGPPTSDDDESRCSLDEEERRDASPLGGHGGTRTPRRTTSRTRWTPHPTPCWGAPFQALLKRKRDIPPRPCKKPCSREPCQAAAALPPSPWVPRAPLRRAGVPAGPALAPPVHLVQPPHLDAWLTTFQSWTHLERLCALDQLIEACEPGQAGAVRAVVPGAPGPAAGGPDVPHWRILAEDNLLWREKCREAGLEDVRSVLGRRVATPPSPGGAPPPIPWKLAFMRHHYVEMNWRCKPIREPKVLRGHEDHVITCLQFSGNRIVSGSDDNTLKVWSASSGRCLRTLVGHTGGVWSSQMAGSLVVSGSTDRTLRVWDADTGHCLHTLYGHTSTVRCMHLCANRVVSGSRDATLRVWDLETGECLHVLVGHVAAVRCVQYNGRLVVSGAYDYMVKVWDPRREECLHTLQGHTNRVYSLQFDGVHVVSGSLDTSIRVWDVETGACRHQLMGHQSLTSGMELRNNILVSGNADSTVKVWDILTGQCLQTLAGANKHQSAVTCLQFNSKFVVTSSDDGTVKLWDLRTGEFLRNLVALESGGSGGVVWRLRASPTKLVCAVGSRNGTEETKLLVLDFDEPK
ncbi:hypothetical protein HPB47_001480 [Ixodes persulcatus]|uniref:Uncharacterized protein n=1 Tax=Ixodes persulcatus TaxID=34615 RepID=A0AC60PPM6_IXOPE|nr:hypothetical protein HPB47_001480 [Ixodes persulcatus]